MPIVFLRSVHLAIVVIALLASASAHAARTFPQNSRQVNITAVTGDSIVADGDTLHLGPGVLIYSTTGTTIVHSALPSGVIARVQFDLNGDVRRIWLLADDEILRRPWWQFWRRGQPQSEPVIPATDQ